MRLRRSSTFPSHGRAVLANGGAPRGEASFCQSVLTHHSRPSLTLGDTTFHFTDADPASVLDRARDAAQGKDVRLGGGATTIREFLDADLVDTMHVAVSQVELGSGSRLWKSPDELLDRFHRDVVPSPSGVTHYLFWRK